MDSYKTLANSGIAEITEKKSKFIAVAHPINGEDEATAILSRVRKQRKDANHNVYAYIVGQTGANVRASDDGEPSGSAGMPVLNVLKGQSIQNAIIVVTRYFGGTLLGTGGLVRAYGLAAKEAVINAGVKTCVLYDTYTLRIGYALLNKFQYELGKKGYKINNITYEADIILTVQTEAGKTPEFLRLSADLSGGAAEAVFAERGYK